MSKKRNNLQIAIDKKMIYEWMMDGLSNHQIVVKLIEEYNYKQDNAYKIVNNVLKNLKPKTEEELNDLKNKYIDMFHILYQKTIYDNDLKTANAVLKNITDLQGLNKINIDAKIDGTFNIEF